MSSLHTKNGFEYKCERSFYGSWVVHWFFRPLGMEIFINYQCDKIKTLKKDLEELLTCQDKAEEYYNNTLNRLSDVNAAQKNLKVAENYFEKVNSPDFDLRGNNPNKEVRARGDAKQRLAGARDRLQKAIEYSRILGNSDISE